MVRFGPWLSMLGIWRSWRRLGDVPPAAADTRRLTETWRQAAGVDIRRLTETWRQAAGVDTRRLTETVRQAYAGSSRGSWCSKAAWPDVSSAIAGLVIVGLFHGATKGDTTMAERARMTAAQLADKLLASEHADVLRESVAWMAAQLMEADVSGQIGAELGERTPTG